MFFLEKCLQGKLVYFVIIVFLFITNLFTLYFLFNEKEPIIPCEPCLEASTTEDNTESPKIKVDLKGYVKNPGVYEVEEGTIINDLIKLAGGLKSEGTTDNINLSKKLNDEDMIVILSKSEVKKLNSTIASSTKTTVSNKTSTSANKTTSLNSNPSSIVTNKKISLNIATKEELMTLSGIGEAKALNIIEYRTKTPFKDISEIKNVSGIGEAIYEKIKDSITVE